LTRLSEEIGLSTPVDSQIAESKIPQPRNVVVDCFGLSVQHSYRLVKQAGSAGGQPAKE
jgi:hypothetical protein